MKYYLFIFFILQYLFAAEWTSEEKMNLLIGNYKSYKYLDDSILNIIEPELNKIYEDANNKVLELLNTKLKYTENESTGLTSFDKNTYDLVASQNPYADKEWLKSYFTTPIMRKVEKEKGRSIEYNLVLSSQIPTWGEVVKFAGGYSNLTKEGISKKNLSKFKLSTVLKLISIVDQNTFEAKIEYEGHFKALEYYKINNPNFTINGNIDFPQISYDNLNNFFFSFDLGEYGKQEILLSKLDSGLHKRLIAQKEVIDDMFDDLVSKDEVDNALFNNPKTKEYSKKWIIGQNKKEVEKRLKIESDLIETNFTIDSKLVSIGYYGNFLNSISIEQKKVILEALENENKKYYKYAKLTILGLGFLFVEDLMMIKSGVFFKKVIDAKPKSNFGDKFYYSFDSTDLGSIIKIETPKKEIKKSKQLFKKRTKWKIVYPKD